MKRRHRKTRAEREVERVTQACGGEGGGRGGCSVTLAALSICTIDHFYEPLN